MILGLAAAMVVTLSCPVPAGGLRPPVTGQVVERFLAPACERCSGRRGIVVHVRSGSAVRATATGPFTFAGQVGGVLWAVQQVAPGVRVTYGRLASLADGLDEGRTLVAGDMVGTAGDQVYLGLRLGETPRDPLRCWVRTLRLVAVDVGRPARPR